MSSLKELVLDKRSIVTIDSNICTVAGANMFGVKYQCIGFCINQGVVCNCKYTTDSLVAFGTHVITSGAHRYSRARKYIIEQLEKGYKTSEAPGQYKANDADTIYRSPDYIKYKTEDDKWVKDQQAANPKYMIERNLTL